MTRSPRLWFCVLSVALAVAINGAALPWAAADAVSDKQAQAGAIAAKIDELNIQIEHYAEAANGARVELDDLNTQTTAAQAKVDKAETEQAVHQAEMRTYAITAYVYGDPSTNAVDSATLPSSQSDAKDGYLRAASDNRRALIDALQASEANVKTQIKQLEQAKVTASAKADDLKNKQQQAQAAVDQQQALKSQVDAELSALIQQAELQRAADERAAAQAAQQQAATGSAPPPTNTPVTNPVIPVRPIPPGPIPPPNAEGAMKAIAYAQAQLGKPYQWGAAGPDTFDCSGLTMMAWQAGGVNLLHYTGSQYAQTRPIPLSAVQPGDLIFYDDFDHVALYIGDGKIIQAPHAGAVVEVSDMYFWNTTMAATRPLG